VGHNISILTAVLQIYQYIQYTVFDQECHTWEAVSYSVTSNSC